MGALVQAHGPATHPFGGFADPLRGLADLRLGQAGQRRDPCRAVVLEKVREGFPALGKGLDKRRVGVAVFQQQVQQAVEQCQVAARPDLQEQVGLVGGGVAPRVDDDQACPGLEAIHQAQEQDRMTIGHVRADDEEQIGLVEILVGARWAIGSQRQFVAGPGAGHAQARVGLDHIGPDKPLGQFVGQVLGFQGHLPGDVEGQRFRAVFLEDGLEPAGGFADSLVHAHLARVALAFVADKGLLHPPGMVQRLGAGAALGAKTPEVGRMLLVAADLDHLIVADLHDDAAADTAIRTHAAHGGMGHGFPQQFPEMKKALCRTPSKRGNTAPLS